MLTKEKLMKVLIKGRYECYVSKDASHNPYTKSEIYDWEFKLEIDDLIFTDFYRGFNPYSGVEYIYEKGSSIPSWSCDYIGYVKQDANVSPADVYKFLKKARESHLRNCKGSLFSDCTFFSEKFRYETNFVGDVGSLLQTENIYYNNVLVAQQLSAGGLKQ